MGKKMSEKDKNDFNDLYCCVKNILGYDNDIPLPKYVILRLRGLQTGKYMENKNIQSYGDTDFGTILAAVRLYKNSILEGFSRNHISDEKYKVNYMCKIIESHLQEVRDLIKRQNSNNVDNIDLSTIDADKVDYKDKKENKKSNITSNPILADLW